MVEVYVYHYVNDNLHSRRVDTLSVLQQHLCTWNARNRANIAGAAVSFRTAVEQFSNHLRDSGMQVAIRLLRKSWDVDYLVISYGYNLTATESAGDAEWLSGLLAAGTPLQNYLDKHGLQAILLMDKVTALKCVLTMKFQRAGSGFFLIDE